MGVVYLLYVLHAFSLIGKLQGLFTEFERTGIKTGQR